MNRLFEVRHVDVFTARPFAGNPAGVVLDATGLDANAMRAIAAELNLPATAFVQPAERPGADHALRWFTSSGVELTFCGHGTVATVHALGEAGRLAGSRVEFETSAGPLPVSIEGGLAWLEPALRACAPYRAPLEPVLAALGVEAAAWAPVVLTTERDLLIPVAGLAALKALAPDLDRLGRLGRERGIRGFALTSRETLEPDAAIHSRFFAPHVGIPEDPATGSLHSALPVWLWEAGVLRASGDVVRLRAEQGDFMGRSGRITCELHLAGGRPARVRVGGPAVTVLTGQLRMP